MNQALPYEDSWRNCQLRERRRRSNALAVRPSRLHGDPDTKVGNRYCSLSPARPFGKIEASTDLSEELPKKRQPTEFLPIGSRSAIGRQSVKYRLVHTVGAIRTRIVHIRASVARAPWPSGHQSLDRKGTPRAGSRP